MFLLSNCLRNILAVLSDEFDTYLNGNIFGRMTHHYTQVTISMTEDQIRRNISRILVQWCFWAKIAKPQIKEFTAISRCCDWFGRTALFDILTDIWQRAIGEIEGEPPAVGDARSVDRTIGLLDVPLAAGVDEAHKKASEDALAAFFAEIDWHSLQGQRVK